MPADFTIVISEARHFGDEASDLPGVFVGNEERFSFNCPRIDRSRRGVLMFKSFGVESTFINRLEINGQFLTDSPAGTGITRNPSGIWMTNTLPIPGNLLRENGNELRIQARTDTGGVSGDLDDFVITNVVVWYKTV